MICNIMKYSLIAWIDLGVSLVVTTAVWGIILDLDYHSQEIEFVSIINLVPKF